MVLCLGVTVAQDGGSKQAPSKDVIYGEWLVIDYNDVQSSPPVQVSCNYDGTLSELGNDPNRSAAFSVVESWVDESGNLFLEVNCRYGEGEDSHNTFELWKYDSSGTIWELNRGLTDFPGSIDPDDPSYTIFNRQ
jgi:hypothetical protein